MLLSFCLTCLNSFKPQEQRILCSQDLIHRVHFCSPTPDYEESPPRPRPPRKPRPLKPPRPLPPIPRISAIIIAIGFAPLGLNPPRALLWPGKFFLLGKTVS